MKLSLTRRKKVTIDPSTGAPVPASTPGAVAIEQAFVTLPYGPVSRLNVVAFRSSKAVLFGLPGVLDNLSGSRAIVFAHGFSQRPRNYGKLLRLLASQGFIVAAPLVWLFDVVWPWTFVEGTGPLACPPTKLQTAVLVDTARTMDLLREQGVLGMHLTGHSMGGAMALSYAGRSPELLKSITLLAPAVGPTVLTKLNQTVALNETDGLERMEELARELPDVDMLLLHGARDAIVPSRDMDETMSALKERKGRTGLGSIERGTHVGFEDKLEVDLPFFSYWDRIVFAIIDTLVYGPIDVFNLDTKEQLQTTKEVLSVWFEVTGSPDAIEKLEKVKTESVIEYTWQGVEYRLRGSVQGATEQREVPFAEEGSE